jgi:hypothetical protein
MPVISSVAPYFLQMEKKELPLLTWKLFLMSKKGRKNVTTHLPFSLFCLYTHHSREWKHQVAAIDA